MKYTTFFLLIGALAAVSLTSGFIGLCVAEHYEKKKHGKPSTFREVYDDNAPSDDEVPDDFTEDFLRFY